MSQLQQEQSVLSAIQYERFVLADLTAPLDGMRIRAYLDPHVFVLQRDLAAKVIEINFNPTAEQMDRLRAFMNKIKTINYDPNYDPRK